MGLEWRPCVNCGALYMGFDRKEWDRLDDALAWCPECWTFPPTHVPNYVVTKGLTRVAASDA